MNAWVVELNLIAGNWFEAIVRATWQGSIALLAVWIVSRGIVAMPARYKSWLWRLAFLKLLIALVWITPILLALLPAKTVTIPSAGPVLEEIGRSSSGVNSLAFADLAPLPEPRVLNWRAWLLMVWVIGLGLGAARIGMQWRSAYRLRRSSLPVANPTCQESLVRLARAFRLHRVPAIRQTETAASPLLVGIFRPAIILPSPILRNCSEAQLEIMLAHELAHLRRRDLWWLWLFALCEIIFFFHPLVWLVRREWNLAAESACDELAVRITRGAPSDYGAKLVDIVSQISTQRPTTHMFAVGMSEPATTLKRRLKAMTAKKNPVAITAAIVLIIMGALALVPCRLVAQAPDAETLARLKEENAKLKQELDATRQEIEVLRHERVRTSQREEIEAKRAADEARLKAQAQRELLNQSAKKNPMDESDSATRSFEEFKTRVGTEKQLEFAEKRLAELEKQFAETHPEVVAQRRKVERLRQYLEKLTIGAVPANPGNLRNRSFTPQQRELLLEEIKLAERQAQSVNKRRENGKATFEELLSVQRELLDLKLQLAELEGSKAEQRTVLLQQLKVAEQQLKEQRKRVEVGVVDADGAISSEREVLRIKRALAAIE